MTFTEMDSVAMLNAMGDDAYRWADAFMELTKDKPVDHALMVAWFANSIEHSSDVRRWRREKEQPAIDAQLAGYLSATLPQLHSEHPSAVYDAIKAFRLLPKF